MRFSFVCLLAILAISATMTSSSLAYSLEPRGFVDSGAAELTPAAAAQAARAQELEFIKRFLPAKERRAPLEGFEDMSGFLRTIDGIQKPRFG